MRSEQNKDWIKMFETWTDQLKFTAEIQSYSRLPTLHLDHDVAKDPKFTHKLKIQMRQQMNDLFTYQIEGKCEQICQEIQSLNTNLQIYEKVQ